MSAGEWATAGQAGILLTLISTILGNYWTYRTKLQALKNERDIAIVHACIHKTQADLIAARAELAAMRLNQSIMHAQNLPVLEATLEKVEAIANGRQ